MMNTVIAVSLWVILMVLYCECQFKYESPYDPVGGQDVESFKVDEWQRYINFHRKQMKDALRDIKKRKPKKKMTRFRSGNRIVAPKFVLSRTQEGFIVKQLESGLESTSSGGFEFPKQPALMTNVKYKYDGSVSPVIKLSETAKGVVGKRLEFGYAQNPGVNWQGRTGSFKEKKSKIIDEKGIVNKDAGINKKFPEGAISLRGTIKLIDPTVNITASQLGSMEPLPSDDSYEVETEEYRDGNDSFGIVDAYYTYTDANLAENDEDNSGDDGNWDNYSLTGED